MKNTLMTAFLLGLCCLLANCDGSSSDDVVVLPANLDFTVEVSGESPGQVTVEASAEKANFFRFYFGEKTSYVEQKEGDIVYNYKESGDYTITVQAHTTSNDFISKSKEVSINLNEDDGIPTTGYTTPTSYEGYALVWQDEFDGEELSSANWTFETGTGSNGWGNNEWQYYRQENTQVRDGYVIIEARKENFGGQNYTSSRIITKDKKEFQYGRVDIRAVLPEGQGIWPALWMLGENINEVSWPACGELDIMEMIGGSGRENTVHGTIHWQAENGYANYGDHISLSSGIFSDEFHVFSIEWDDQSIKWYMDDILFNEADITPDHLSEFHNEFFFIMNVAVGGNWPGYPDETTTFPQRMIVDYIRVFQKE